MAALSSHWHKATVENLEHLETTHTLLEAASWTHLHQSAASAYEGNAIELHTLQLQSNECGPR